MKTTIQTVNEYIAKQPKEARKKLEEIRAAIIDASSGSTENMEYFQIPGYSYKGYNYNGMFAWFSFSNNSVRLHVRPPVLQANAHLLKSYKTTKAIVSFPIDGDIPTTLVKKLVNASIKEMKNKVKELGKE